MGVDEQSLSRELEERMMEWSTLPFRKHKGKTFPQVLFHDPQYFFWLHAQGTLYGSLAEEAKDLYRKARAIRIPLINGKEHHVKYDRNPRTRKITGLYVVAAETPLRWPWVCDVIDLAVPYEVAGWDKLGYKIVIDSLKKIVFGDAGRRMTKERCEEFYANRANFVL